MKKTLFLAVLAGAALAGCVKNEEVAPNDGSPELITFDAPVVTIPTKATEIEGNYPKDCDFGVYALHTDSKIGVPTTTPVGDMYMDNEQCVANNPEGTPTYWSPASRAYYWPKNGYLTFAAYAPSTEATSWPTNATVAWDAFNGFTFTDFTVNETPAEQIDLLYSAPVYDQTESNMADNNNPYNGITIPFKHALSSIVFVAKTDDVTYGSDKISITKIEVKNVYGQGDFDQNHYVDGGTQGDASWITKGAATNYKVYEGAGVELTTTEQPINGPVDPDPTDGKQKSDLILIPQTLNGRGAGIADATVEIIYKITYSNGDTTTEKVTFNLAVADTDGDGSLQYVWEMGKRYTYHIIIGLQKIYFNPTVETWTNIEGEMVGGNGGAVEQI